MNRRQCIFTLLFIAALAAPLVAYAQGFVPLAPAPSGPLATAYQSNSLSSYFNALFNIALSVGAIAAVLRLVYAGYLYMSSDIVHKKEHAKIILGDVVLGTLLLLGVYIILAQINPNILNLNILQDFSTPASSGYVAPGSTSAN